VKPLESTWSPFQSAEVREICAHLTPGEHARLLEDAQQRGARIGLWLAGPLGLSSALLVWRWQIGAVLLALYVPYFLVFGLPRLRAMRRRSMELLCDTEWARSRGYDPATLRLMNFPWSH
jgi:hypothetical protein